MIIFQEFDAETKQKAEALYKEKEKRINLNWHLKFAAFNDLTIFHECNCVMGMPKNEFLKRVVNIRPYIRPHKNNEPFEGMLKTSFDKLNDLSFGSDNREYRVVELHQIRSILAVNEFRKNALKWFEESGELVGMGLLQSLNHENMYVVTETCYVAAYIVHFLKQHIPIICSQALIKGCIDIISMRVMDLEDYVEDYRVQRARHEDMELFAGKELPFHWPKFQCHGVCNEYTAISCSIYTLAFIFQHNPHPKILLFFQNQIYCRREIVRYILFKLYLVVIKTIDKTLFERDEWKKLPHKLYSELGKALIDKNILNKQLINEIIHFLQEISSVRLPPISANMYQAMEHLKVGHLEPKDGADKPSHVKSSIRLVLKTTTSKVDKEAIEFGTENSLTEDSDNIFKENLIYQRKSLFVPEVSNNLQTGEKKETPDKSQSRMSVSVGFANL